MEIKKLDPAIKRYIKRIAYKEKQQALCEYHTWFAWFPVRIDDNTLVWLEKVGRIGEMEWYRGWDGLSKKIGSWKYFKINSK